MIPEREARRQCRRAPRGRPPRAGIRAPPAAGGPRDRRGGGTVQRRRPAAGAEISGGSVGPSPARDVPPRGAPTMRVQRKKLALLAPLSLGVALAALLLGGPAPSAAPPPDGGGDGTSTIPVDCGDTVPVTA